MNKKYISFLELWQDIKVEDMSDKQLLDFHKILKGGIREVQSEIMKRENIKEPEFI